MTMNVNESALSAMYREIVTLPNYRRIDELSLSKLQLHIYNIDIYVHIDI